MLTLHRADLVLPIAAGPIAEGGVLLDGDRISAVGPADALAADHPRARVRAWSGVIVPGLANAHTHLQYTDFHDLADLGLRFPQWIQRMAARRATFTDADWLASTRRGVHDLLRTGTTAAADIVTEPCAFGPSAKTGLAGTSYLEVLGADKAGWIGGARERFLQAIAAAPAGRAVGVSPHTLYTVAPEVVADAFTLARERGLRLHPHLAETAEEDEFARAGTGPLTELVRLLGMEHPLMAGGGSGASPTSFMDGLGGLGPDVHVAHGVWCDEADRGLLADRGTAVALCVRSNRVLDSGEPPIAAYLSEGRPFALGTDSLASSPSLDLLEEAVAARALARAQGYDRSDLDRRLVEAATRGGAAALGLADVGVLQPGARADLAVFDIPVTTDSDPYRALLDHGPGRCQATVLGGRLVHRA